MTRLDASNEPSMEDILASIRKIIAEDPPGSRPSPPAAVVAPRAPDPFAAIQSQAAQQSAAFGASALRDTSSTPLRDTSSALRDTALDSKPATQDAVAPNAVIQNTGSAALEAFAPEPYLKTVPFKTTADKPSPASAIPQAAPFFPKASAPSSPRIEPSFEALPATAPAAASATTTPSPAMPLSVDAQLSDLLGDVMSSAPLPMPAAPDRATPSAAAAPAQAGFPASLTARLPGESDGKAKADAPMPAPLVEHRGGFTISRDGFQPSAPPPASKSEAERDPFDFDLGPSPFELAPVEQKAEAKAAEPTPAAVAVPVMATEPVVAVARAETAAALPVTPPVAEPVAAKIAEAVPRAEAPFEPSAAAKPSSAHTIAAHTMAGESAKPFVFAAPSVAATLAPKVPADAAVAPVQAVEPTPAGSKPLEAVTRDVIAVESEAQPVTETEADVSADVRIRDSRHVAVVEHAHTLPADGTQRTMEDTVADLLRPMLRTWLSENMPRIVERALRREISEQLHSEHKTAAE